MRSSETHSGPSTAFPLGSSAGIRWTGHVRPLAPDLSIAKVQSVLCHKILCILHE